MGFLRWLTYSSSDKRDLRLDYIRGYCVFMMIVDHVSGPSWLYLITGNNRWVISAAEGFVLISGLVMGIVYRPTYLRLGFEEVTIRAFDRAKSLYLLFVGLTFAMTGMQLALGTPASKAITEPTAWILGVITLHQSSYLTDVMLFYTLAVALSPIVFLAFHQGKTFAMLVFSWTVWLVYQISPNLADYPWPILNQDAFPLAAWQVLFVSGLAIGYHRDKVEKFIRNLPGGPILPIIGFASLLVVVLFLDRIDVLLGSMTTGRLSEILTELFYKFDVRPGRILGIIAVFPLFYAALTYFWGPIKTLTGWLIIPLGQHALDAYSVHIFFVVLVGALRTRVVLLYGIPEWANTVLQLLVVLMVYALIKYGVIDWLMGRTRSRPALAPARA